MARIKRQGLITLDGVKELLAGGAPFAVRYDLVGMSEYGNPKYHCVYEFEGEGGYEEYALVATRFGPRGPQPRELALWPGVFRHHHAYGGDRPLCIARDWTITVGEIDA